MIIVKTDQEIELMREAGRIVAECHALLGELVKPGVTTIEIDRLVEEKIRSRGLLLALKGIRASPPPSARPRMM